MSGKGSKPRPVNREKWSAGWDRIFGAEGKSTGSGQDGGSTPPCSKVVYGPGHMIPVKPTQKVNKQKRC